MDTTDTHDNRTEFSSSSSLSKTSVPSTTSPSLLLSLLHQHTRNQPTKTVFTYLSDDGESVISSVTYEELNRITESLANQLLRIPVGPTSTDAAVATSSSSHSQSSTSPSTTLQRGDRVLLVYLPSLDFIVTFIACLRAGLVAVPVYPPDPRNLKVNIALFTSIAYSSSAKVILTHATYTNAVSLGKLKDSALRVFSYFSSGTNTNARTTNDWPSLPWFTTTLQGTIVELSSSSSSSSIPTINPSILDQSTIHDLAFLQYTSGSTSEPKGVMISHGNLAHNLHTIVTSLAASTSTIVVSWLPQYHDMGLIGSYLGILACGGSGYYMSPLSFIKKPIVWLQLISKYKGTHIQAPNFAYILATRKFKEALASSSIRPAWLENFSLGSLQHCFNAAEPITGLALYDFIQTFVPYQFSIPSLAPGYGLAEHTVYVSDRGTFCIIAERSSLENTSNNSPNGTVTDNTSHTHRPTVNIIERIDLSDLAIVPRQRLIPTKSTVILVSCGPVYPYNIATSKNTDINVLIVDPDTHRVLLDDNCIGEIWIHSPSKAQGYYNRPEQTKEAFYGTVQPPLFATEIRENDNAVQTVNEAKISDEESKTDTTNEAKETSTKPPPTVRKRTLPQTVSAFTATHPFPTELYTLSYLNTGDLGFIDNGELFITGRMKDLIILRGRNFYPQDIEQVVESSLTNQIRPGCTAVFTLPGGNEEVILATELRPDLQGESIENIVTLIRTAVMRDFGIRLTAIVLLKPHGIRKTTSGKVARAWNAKAYQSMERNDPGSPWSSASGLVHIVAKDTVTTNDDEWLVPKEESTTENSSSNPTASPAATVPNTTADGSIISMNNTPLFGTVEGPKLLAYLRKDIAQLLGIPLQAPPPSVPPVGTDNNAPLQPPPLTAANLPITISLLNLGLDSLSLMQLQGKLQAEYNLTVKDEQMFSEETTIQWIVQHARELRGQGTDNQGTANAADGAGTSRTTTTNPAENGNNTSTVVPPFEIESVPPGVEIADPEELMRMYYRNGNANGRKKGPSFMESNCPCFLWCCGK